MNTTPGFDFTETQASELVKVLQDCLEQLDGTIAYTNKYCADEVALPYKLKMAEIMAGLAWDILEQGFYKKYPQLRPLDSCLRK